MRNRLVFVSLFLIMMANCSHKIERIALVGDSITQDIRYVRSIRAKFPNQEIHIYAKWGKSSTVINAYFQEWLDIDPQKCDYDIVVVFWGINNIDRPKTIIDDYLSLSKKLGKRPTLVGVCLLPWAGFPGWEPEYYYHSILVNKTMHSLEQEGVIDLVIDATVLMGSEDNPEYLHREFTEDGLHLSEKGNEQLSLFYETKIKEYVSQENNFFYSRYFSVEENKK